MSCFQGLSQSSIFLVALGAGLSAQSPILCAATFNQNIQREALVSTAPTAGVQNASTRLVVAQAKSRAPQPAPAIAREPSSADIVNKMLSPGPSDPNVPLPRAGLSEETADPASVKRPSVYGRAGDGGAVFGFTVPLPSDRNGSPANTRYGSGSSGFESSPQDR